MRAAWVQRADERGKLACRVPLGVGIVGDKVSVEVKTRDADLFFDGVDEHGEQNNLLLLGVIAVGCTIGHCARWQIETRVLWWGGWHALKYHGLS